MLAAFASLAGAQTAQKPATTKKAPRRANELTLAGLRPGRDSMTKALRLYRKAKALGQDLEESAWEDPCFHEILKIDKNKDGGIQTVRVTQYVRSGIIVDCKDTVKNRWRAGRGLSLWDSVGRVVQLYGPPDSKSPSTRDGQPLELWYYAFDWAGPDVPQVMEVLCTREKEGQPGHVVEITLAAASL